MQGELVKLGHPIAASTVWQIMHDAGIGPAPRRTGPTWKQFLTRAGPRRSRGRLRPRGHRAPPSYLRLDRHRARHPPRSPGRHHREPEGCANLHTTHCNAAARQGLPHRRAPSATSGQLNRRGAATLAHRVVTYWLPLPAGGVAYVRIRLERTGRCGPGRRLAGPGRAQACRRGLRRIFQHGRGSAQRGSGRATGQPLDDHR